MYCIKCGKPTVGDERLCEECKAAEKAAAANENALAANEPNTTMLGFGKALTSIITGFGVLVVSAVLNSTGMRMNPIAMIFLMIIDIAAIVVAIFFGAKAIRAFSSFKATSDKKPYPAFILGIIGVVLAGIAAVMIIVFLFVDLPEIMVL